MPKGRFWSSLVIPRFCALPRLLILCHGSCEVKDRAGLPQNMGCCPVRQGHAWIEAARGKQSGRTQEIQRLIGRSLRAVVDLSKMPDYTITVDCDVIQADGGTRTAAITGACVALVDALVGLQRDKVLKQDPLRQLVASVSVGLYQGVPVLDLDYPEDSSADTDMNVVMGEDGGLIEVQGTAEGATFDRSELNTMLDLAEAGIRQLFEAQRQALAEG